MKFSINIPKNKKIILIDRSYFQEIEMSDLAGINKQYAILCPDVFIAECVAPRDASNIEKKALLKKLSAIEDFTIFAGSYNNEQTHVVLKEHCEIIKHCLISTANIPIVIQPYEPKEEIIADYQRNASYFHKIADGKTQLLDQYEGRFAPNKVRTMLRNLLNLENNSEAKKILRELQEKHKTPFIGTSKEIDHISKITKEAINNMPDMERIEGFSRIGNLSNSEELMLKRRLELYNSPTPAFLAYPSYSHYLEFLLIVARTLDTDHLDLSYMRDWRYLHYLPFCDLFLSGERSFEYVIKSLPDFLNIKQKFITKENFEKRHL